MKRIWYEKAWKEYELCLEQDRRAIKKINKLLVDIERNGEKIGLGKPEALIGNFSGWYSREIDKKNRLIYRVTENGIEIISCRTHYGDK